MGKKRNRIRYQVRKYGKDPRFLAMCYGKRRFKEYEDANKDAQKKVNAHVYACEFCEYYHVGRRNQSKKYKKKTGRR